MSGGGPSSSSTTQYPAWAMPFAVNNLQQVQNYASQDLANGYNPNLNYNVAPFDPYQNQGFLSGEQGAEAGQYAINPTIDNVAATQSGAFLNPSSNPYLAATFNAAAQPLTTQFRDATAPGINGMFAQAGSFGGSANQQEMSDAQQNLGNSLSNLATGIYGGNYQQERQNQLTQQGMLGSILNASEMPSQELLSLGGQQQAQQQNVLNTNTQNAQQQVQYPFTILQQVSQALGQDVGNSGVTKVQSGGKGLF